jgi:WD40 repeat protein
MGGVEAVAPDATAAAAAAASSPPALSAGDVPVRLVAGVNDAALRGADGAELTVPSRMGRKALRDLLHHLLGLAAGGPDFHFLAPGGVALRTTLAKFVARRGLSTETALVLTYYLPLPAPVRRDPVGVSKEWLADVAVFSGGAAAEPLLLAASYSGCPTVSTPSAVLVAEDDVRGAAHGAPVKAVAWLEDGRGFVSAGHDEVAKLWSYEGGAAAVCGVFRSDDVGATPFESAAATSCAGKDIVALGGSNGSVWVVDDLSQCREAASPAAPAGSKRKHAGAAELSVRHLGVTSADLSVTCLRWRGDGALVSAGLDGMVRVWDAGSAAVKLSVPGGGKAVTGLAESAASFVVSAADGAVRLLDARGGRGVVGCSGRGKGHAGMASGVTWIVPDASFASGGLDGSVRAWDMRALDTPVHVVDGVHGKDARSLGLALGTHDGRATVFSAGEDGQIHAVSFDM